MQGSGGMVMERDDDVVKLDMICKTRKEGEGGKS